MTFRVVINAPAPGEANMRADTEMAAALGRGEIPPTFRLYGWSPPAVSIGFHQSPGDFDEAGLRKAGISLVRRPTGGRAILHWHELTYCAVIPERSVAPKETYRLINEALLAGVRILGIDAVLSGGDPDIRRHVASAPGITCFSFSARSEIQFGGKKLVGSAQRRFKGVLLQHGSFLLGPQHRRLEEFISIRHGEGPETPGEGFFSKTTEAETILGRPVPFDEAARAVAEGVSVFFGTSGHGAGNLHIDNLHTSGVTSLP